MPEQQKNIVSRLVRFIAALAITLVVIFGGLPLLNDSFSILTRMSAILDQNDIDPTRYYYTDVAQVAESERYLSTVLNPH